MSNQPYFLPRKLFHLAFIIVPFLYAESLSFNNWLLLDNARITFSLFFAFLFAAHFIWIILKRHSSYLQSLYNLSAARFLKKKEPEFFPGSLLLLLSIALTIFLYTEKIGVLALLPGIIGDPFAALAGKVLPIIRLQSKKSIGGFLFGIATSFLSILWFINHYHYDIFDNCYGYLLILTTLIIVFLLELLLRHIDDNLFISLLTGLGLYLSEIFLTAG